MTKPDLDEMLEELAKSQRPTLATRLGRHPAVMGSAVTCAGGAVVIHAAGLDAHLLIRGMVLAGPVIAVGLVIFVRAMWEQNFVAAPTAVGQVDAEPAGHPDLANLASDPDVADEPDLTNPGQPTIVVTVHPLPAPAELPAALTADRPAGDYEYVTREEPDGHH